MRAPPECLDLTASISEKGTNSGRERLRDMDWLRKDLVYAIRGLRREPGFAAVAIVTLALGIGSATTIFSAIQNILLDPVPLRRRARASSRSRSTTPRMPVRAAGPIYQTPEFLDYQEQSHVFSEVIGGTGDDVLWNNGEGTEQFDGGLRHAEHVPVPAACPALLGRGIVPDDARPGAPPVFVMAYKMWSARFFRDPSILGKCTF